MEASKLPEIHAAQATPTAPPPAVPVEPDPEAENDVHQVAPSPDAESSETPSSSEAPSDASSEGSSDSEGGRGIGSGTGSGGGHGSGIGTGTGSGYGPGSGSGSGGGNGSGIGTGNGDGEGPGNGDSEESAPSGEITPPQVLSTVEPVIPQDFRQKFSGATTVGVTIETDGSVSSAWVAGSCGNSILDEAAVQCLYKWRFVPAKQGGVPIVSRITTTVGMQVNVI